MSASLDSQQLIFSGTQSRKGRQVSVSPDSSSLAHLNYGRIQLDTEVPRAAFDQAGSGLEASRK